MMFKSYPLAAATVSALGWLVAAAAPLQAQLPTASPTSTPRLPKPKTGHIRFINALPLDGGTLELVSVSVPNGPAVQIAPPSNFYMGYIIVPPVRTTYNVFRVGNRQNIIKSVDVPLKGDAYFTVVAQLQGDGKPTAELVNETPDPNVPPTNRLTLRQFFRGAQITINAASGQQAGPLGYGEAQTLVNLPNGVVHLAMSAKVTVGGPPRTLNLDANFQNTRRMSVFFVMDPYDRLRPRITVDGPTRAEEDAALTIEAQTANMAQ